MPDIRTDQLVERLRSFALGDDAKAMTYSQITAALALLDRVLPDLHRIELTTSADQPISVTIAETTITKIATE
jgi:hypothetical protein